MTSGATIHPFNFPLKRQLERGEFSITKLYISLVFSLQFILFIYEVLRSMIDAIWLGRPREQASDIARQVRPEQ